VREIAAHAPGTWVAKGLVMSRTLAAFLLAFLTAVGAARAQTAAVLPPSGVNVAAGLLEATQDLLRGHLLATQRFAAVLAVPGPVGKSEVAPLEALAQAQAAGADLAIVVHLTRLTSTAQVRVSAYSTATGARVFTDQLAAASPDDLDAVLLRLARALASGKPARDTADLDSVTELETVAPHKRSATHVFGLGIGVELPSGGDAMPGMSLYWLYDARTFLADASIGFHAANGRGDFACGIGGYLPFGSADLAPYLGGGVRWAAGDTGSGPGNGLELFGALGGIAGRLGSVQLRGQLEYFVDLHNVHSTSTTYSAAAASYMSTTSTSVNHGAGLLVGLGF
jgi:hypothetical protein